MDEEGTEAAAATAALISVTSAPIITEPPPQLVFDRPFIFALVHDPTGARAWQRTTHKPGGSVQAACAFAPVSHARARPPRGRLYHMPAHTPLPPARPHPQACRSSWESSATRPPPSSAPAQSPAPALPARRSARSRPPVGLCLVRRFLRQAAPLPALSRLLVPFRYPLTLRCPPPRRRRSWARRLRPGPSPRRGSSEAWGVALAGACARERLAHEYCCSATHARRQPRHSGGLLGRPLISAACLACRKAPSFSKLSSRTTKPMLSPAARVRQRRTETAAWRAEAVHRHPALPRCCVWGVRDARLAHTFFAG